MARLEKDWWPTPGLVPLLLSLADTPLNARPSGWRTGLTGRGAVHLARAVKGEIALRMYNGVWYTTRMVWA